MTTKLIENNQVLVINDRWEIDTTGTIYDTYPAKNIPQWIFEFKDFILKHKKTMFNNK